MDIAYDCSFVLSFFSQLCLCWIFWHLATKETDQYCEVIAVDWDEEASVQARIWNQFVRAVDEEIVDGESQAVSVIMTVTPQQVMQS